MNYLESPHSRSEIMAQTNKRRGQRSPVEPSFMSVPLQYDQRHTASTSDLHIACGPNGYAENDNSRGRQTFHRERRHIRPDHIRPKRPISAQIYAQNSSSESRESLTNVHLTLPRKSALRRAAESLDSTGSLPTMQGPHEPNELLEAPARKPPAPLHGVILKNRKRPMKGWHERFFSLNNGCLAYAKTSNSLRQGRSLTQIDLANTCVTAAPEKLGIDIDAASLVCHLKFEEPERFQQWLTAIREHRAYDQYRNASLSTGRPGASQPTWSAASTLSGDGAVSTSSGSSAHTGDSLQGVGKTKVKRLPKVQSDFSLRPPEHLLRHSSEQITAIENLLRKLESIYKNLQDTLDESVEQNKRENDTDTTSYSPTRSLFFSPVPFPQADATSPNTKPSQAVQHSRHSSSSSMTSMYTAIQEADTLVDDPQLTSRAQSKIKKGINLVDFATEFTKEAKKFIEESNGALATLRLLNSSSTYATSPSKERASTLTDANKVKHRSMIDSGSEVGDCDETGSDDSPCEPMPILSESNMNVPDMKGVVLANPEPVAGRRISLPARQPTHPSFSLLAILRSNIGRDLTKLKLPVVLNEPLSTLQNQCEELEYSHLLDAASEMEEQTKRMLYVTTFAISAYARTASRTATMPFTPLLGETFECVRPERQWRFLGEQVSHNPPVTASHCESKLWSLYQEFNMKSKFWGKSLEIVPVGCCQLYFPRWQETYTWNKVTTSITNVFSPTTLSIDHTGDLTIKCSNGASSTVHFNQHDSKRPDVRRYVCGTVNPPKGSSEDPRLLYGHWDKILVSRDENGENRCIWRANPLPPNSAHYYGFTKFAIELNEPPVADAVSSGRLPITDSRLRPDQRFLELGRIEEAEIEKTRLEDEQRHRLKMHKTTENSRDRSSSSIWKPHWFTYKPKSVPATDQGPSYEFNPAYWRFRDSCGFKDLKLPILW